MAKKHVCGHLSHPRLLLPALQRSTALKILRTCCQLLSAERCLTETCVNTMRACHWRYFFSVIRWCFKMPLRHNSDGCQDPEEPAADSQAMCPSAVWPCRSQWIKDPKIYNTSASFCIIVQVYICSSNIIFQNTCYCNMHTHIRALKYIYSTCRYIRPQFGQKKFAERFQLQHSEGARSFDDPKRPL